MTAFRTPSITKLLFASMFVLAALAPATAHAKRVSLALAYGNDVLLAGDETLSLRAQCVANESGADRLRVYVVTASDAVMRGADSYVGNGSYLGAGSPPMMSELLTFFSAPVGQEFAGSQIDSGVYVLNLAERKGYAIPAETAAGTLNVGSTDCLLSVEIETIKNFKEAQ